MRVIGQHSLRGNVLNCTVGEYNASTGAAINANFITGLNQTYAIALSGNNLFVTNNGGSTVGEYSATTGAAINSNFITGLSYPSGLVLSGNNLFVANVGSDTIGEYNVTTGAAINANFITGLNIPTRSRCRATTSSWRTTSATRLANTTPPPEPRSTPTSSRG
jgi:hypothetical protein